MRYCGVLERHGVRLAFQTANRKLWQAAGRRWGELLEEREVPGAIMLEVLPARVEGEIFHLALSWSGSRLRVTAGGCHGILEQDEGGRFVLVDNPRVPDQLLFTLENVLRLGWSRAAGRAGTLLVHGAGLVCQEGSQGVLFSGTSGSGKSTAAALAATRPGIACLGDDLVMLGGEGGAWIGDTPFTPRAGREERKAVLRGALLLTQALAHRVVPLSFPEAFSEILSQCLGNALSPRETVRVLSRLEAWLRPLPLGRLEFCKDPGFWEKVEECTGLCRRKLSLSPTR